MMIPVAMCTALACGGTDGAPIPESDALPTMPAGRYAITTEVDLTTVPDWTASIEGAVTPVRELSNHPAGSILGERMSDRIPRGLEGKFREWFNGEVLHGGKIDLAKLEQSIEAMLGKFQILSTLEVTGSHATHTITGLAFDFGAQHLEVDVEDTSQSVPVRGDTLGGHQFTIPFGDFGAAVLDTRIENGLRTVIGTIVDCNRISNSVSKKCLASQCVGNQTEIEEVCRNGLDQVTTLALAEVKKLRFDPLKLSGTLGNNLEGKWAATIDLGSGAGPEQLVSKFSARPL